MAALCVVLAFGCKRSDPADARSETTAPRPVDTAPAPAATRAPAARSAADPPEARDLRERLVREIAAEPPWDKSPGWDARVLEAMRKVPRHQFVPEATLRRAYEDRPQAIGFDQTISQPAIVAIMTDALDLVGTERVLEIGTGSGYQAAVLSVLAKEVYTIEIVQPLGERARDRLQQLGYANVHVRVGDGYAGWPEKAPFPRILLTAAPPEVPKALVEQLAEGGILVAPVGPEGQTQRLVRWTKRGGKLDKEDLGAVRFVPMVKGSEP